MNMVRQLYFLARDWKALIALHESHKARETREAEREILIERMQLLGASFRGLGHPARDIGSALRFADDVGIELHIGTCYAQCRAVLPQCRWTRDIRPEAKSCEFGSFYENQPHDEIQEIYAFAPEAPLAVAKCWVYARIAGVI